VSTLCIHRHPIPNYMLTDEYLIENNTRWRCVCLGGGGGGCWFVWVCGCAYVYT